MNRAHLASLAAAGSLAVLSQPAQAHVDISHTTGLSQGFAHPIVGLDHVLAMFLVGILAAQMGGRAMWLVPAAFVTVMALGGVVGAMGIGLPLVELGIGLSVVVLGAVVALGRKMTIALTVGLVGFFAIFHGFAHGAEMPAANRGFVYATGFVLATAALHAFGVGFGLALSSGTSLKVKKLLRATGGAAVLAGAAIVTWAF